MPSIIIINWNNFDATRSCIDSALCQTFTYKNIIVVDNGSEDDSYKKLSEAYKDRVYFIKNEKNYGFSGGVNPGIKYAISQGAEFIWLLNNDAILDESCLYELVKESEKHNHSGVVGSVIYEGDSSNKTKKVEVWGGGHLNHLTGRTHISKNKKMKINYISGASMLIPARIIKKIGLFDEDFFMYYEDVDFCTRASFGGFKLLVAERAYVWHQGSASTKGGINPRKDKYSARSCVIFFKKHYGWLGMRQVVVAMGVRLLRRIVTLRFNCAYSVILGVKEGVLAKKK